MTLLVTPFAAQNRSVGLLAAFTFYFLGFYVYSVLVFDGMPAYLEGFVVYGAAICLPLLLRAYLKLIWTPAATRGIDAIFWILLSYFMLWMTVVDAPNLAAAQFNKYVGIIIVWSMLFMLGRLVPVYRKNFLPLALLIFVLLCLLTLTNIENGQFAPAQSPDTYATYQSYAMVLVMLSFSLLYVLESEFLFWLIAVLTIILLAIIGSRSELVGFLSIVVFVAVLQRPSFWRALLLLSAVAGLYASYLYLTSFEWNRLINLVDEGAESTLGSRSEFNTKALDTILANPLLGDFGSYEDGSYAHNILSIWVDFGLLGISMYVFLLSSAIYGLLFRVGSPHSNKRSTFAVAVWLYCAVLLVATKSGEYYLVPFSMGLLASHLSISLSLHLAPLSKRRMSI